MGCLSSHLFVHTLSVRMELRRSPARPPGGRCLGRKTSGAWPPTPPRPCLLTSVPQPSPRPPLPWERFRVMVSATRDLWHLRSHIHICSAHPRPRGASQFRRCVTVFGVSHTKSTAGIRAEGLLQLTYAASSDQVQLLCRSDNKWAMCLHPDLLEMSLEQKHFVFSQHTVCVI